MRDEIRRTMPLFPMRIVSKLTELTPRQIRYYEEQGLIQPARTKGKQRLFSFRDVDRLLQIKALLEQGLNLAGVKMYFAQSEQMAQWKKESEKAKKELSMEELRWILKRELIYPDRPGKIPLTHGEFTRFFLH